MKARVITNKFMKYSAEIFIILGLINIIYATFKINNIAGFYAVGFICSGFGFLFAKGR